MGIFEKTAEEVMTVRAGQAAILPFPAIKSSPPPDVTWQTQDEGPMTYSQKYTKSKMNELVILATDKSDEKAYRYVDIFN